MKNSQKGFVAKFLVTISILAIGGVTIFLNKDKIFGDSILNIGSKLGTCVIGESRGDAISVNVAQAVALNQINKNYTAFNWVSVGYYPIYKSSGEINYYAFVFRKTEYLKFITLDSLEQNASKYSDTTQGDSDKKYQFNDVASVLTGVTDGDDLIISHYKGIPEIIGKKIEIRNYIQNKYPNKTIGNIIADSPMSKTYYFEIVNKSDNLATGEIVGLDYAIRSKSELVNYQAEVNNGKNKQYMSLGQNECNIFKQALVERKAYLKNKWSEYSK